MGRAVRDRGADAAAAVKVAVTGASGFVGSHVLNALVACEGVEIVATSRSAPPVERMPSGVRHVALDLAEVSESTYEALGCPDVLIHLAWAGLPNYLSLHHFERELPIQYRFLRTMVESGLPSMVISGTCYEYGMVQGELDETLPGVPGNPYAFAKAALFSQLQFLRTAHPFALSWARLFYMFGKGQAAGSIFSLLTAAVERGDESFAMSGGEQVRDYLPVERIAAAIAELALNHPDAGIVNICSGKPISVRRLVEGWIQEHGWAIKPELGVYPYPSHEPMSFWGATEKARSLGLGSIIEVD